MTCLRARLKGCLTLRSPGCHLRCVFKVRGCLRGFRRAVYPPPARREACRSVASLTVERDSSELEGFSQSESQKAPRHLPQLAATAEPQSKKIRFLQWYVLHRDYTCTSEHGCFLPRSSFSVFKISHCVCLRTELTITFSLWCCDTAEMTNKVSKLK